MKLYLILAALGPFLGGFFMLVASTVTSGYWDHPTWAEATKLFVDFLKTLQYSYLFGILPILMIAAVDDIDGALALLQSLSDDDRSRLASSDTPLAVMADVRTPEEAMLRFESLDQSARLQLLAMFERSGGP